jgi:hypothetical protein
MTGLLLSSTTVTLALTILQAQTPRQPARPAVPIDPTRASVPTQPPAGRRVHVQDGDFIVVEHGARVRLLHRREGTVHVIADPQGHYVIVLADFNGPANRRMGASTGLTPSPPCRADGRSTLAGRDPS